jgi:iron complex transport system substrate-binding protein
MVPNRLAVILGSAILAAAAWTLPAKAQDVEVLPDRSRLVAIGGSITEIVYALGEQETLVARDSTSVYPPEAFSLPDVGYIRQLSPEGVLSVNPSGILALHGAGPREAVDVLRKASVPYVEVPDTFDHAGILVKIRAVGQALGVEEKAERLAREVDANLAAAEKRTAGIADRKRVLFILSMQDGRILASGTETAANGIIAMAGAVNAIDGYTGYKQVSEEAIITAAPDVILMMDRAGSLAVSDEDLFAHPAIASTPAGASRRVVRMDGAYLLGFGPRTAQAIDELAVALYGDQVDD